MTIANLKALPFEDKVRLLPAKEQSYLQGYVDRALTALKDKQTEQSRKPPVDRPLTAQRSI